MPPPVTTKCACGGYGAGRARRGEANPCLADKNLKVSKRWQLKATVKAGIERGLADAGYKESRAREASAAVLGYVNGSE